MAAAPIEFIDDEAKRFLRDMVLIGVTVYLGYRVVNNFLGPAAQVITKPLAQAWVWATSPDQVKASGRIVLPSGTVINASDIQQSWFSGGAMRFTYNGSDYLVEQNPTGGPAYDMEGDYHAKAVSG